MPVVPLPEWKPDLSDLGTNSSINILNVVPRTDGYGPFPSIAQLTASLPDVCRGYFYARNSDGTVSIFAGTSTNLYLLNNTSFTWSNVSLGGGPYSALTSTDNWQFAQFNSLVLATQANVPLQVFDLSSATAFSNNAGSPPQARYIKIVSRFIVLSGLLSNPTRAQWSDLDNTTEWTPGVGQSDFQDLPDGGIVGGIAGGDQYGIIFQGSRIRTITFNPGSPEVFDILAFPSEDGLFGSYSIVAANNGTFFISPQGFKFIPYGGVPTPIGKDKFDTTFFADVDFGNLQLLIGAADPQSSRVFWAYKSIRTALLLFDTVICYDWVLNRATKVNLSGEYLASLSKPGITLEALDAIAPGAIAVTGAANNGGGLIRLAVAATATLTTGQVVAVGQANPIVGTVEANGNWTITVIDGTHVDLQGSAFVHAYVSGGSIGGSIDAMTASLDSFSTSSASSLSVVNPAHAIGVLNGPALEAVMETAEQDGDGFRMVVQGLRPITDASTAMCSIAARDNAQAVSVYTAEQPVNVQGVCPQRIDTRYARAKLRVPAGSLWTYARGIEPIGQRTGTR